MNHKEIAKNIRAYCALKGYTVKDFEVKTGTANGSVKTWEKGKTIPTLRTMERIAKKTGIPIQMWLTKGAFGEFEEERREPNVPPTA